MERTLASQSVRFAVKIFHILLVMVCEDMLLKVSGKLILASEHDKLNPHLLEPDRGSLRKWNPSELPEWLDVVFYRRESIHEIETQCVGK